eukprot:6146356-Amphidinium_carterae.1
MLPLFKGTRGAHGHGYLGWPPHRPCGYRADRPAFQGSLSQGPLHFAGNNRALPNTNRAKISRNTRITAISSNAAERQRPAPLPRAPRAEARKSFHMIRHATNFGAIQADAEKRLDEAET